MGIGKKTYGFIVFSRRTRAQDLLFPQNNGRAIAGSLVCRRDSHTKLRHCCVPRVLARKKLQYKQACNK